MMILGCSDVSRISFRGGGGGVGFKIFLEKWGRLLGGFGGYPPPRKLKKWCKLVRFGEYFAKILLKKYCKNIHFCIKIINNVLLRTLYFGVLEHTPQISCQLCNLVCFGAHFP